MDLLAILPRVRYDNKYNVSNLLAKITTVRENLNHYTVFYPYEIKDGERPDTIAYDYYNDSKYAWLVMLVNDITDPYYQWPLDSRQFFDYLMVKYGQVHELKSVIDHYRFQGIGGNTELDPVRINYKMTPETFAALSVDDKAGWQPIYLFDYEVELNDNKRNIQLLSNQYIKQVDRELSSIFNVS